MLFMIFAICPVPTPPQWVMSVAMQASSGRMRANTAGWAPTMMLSVPSSAAWRVRAMGASA